MARHTAQLRLFAWVFLLLGPAASQAGDWKVAPRLSVEETYTDNVRLQRHDRSGDFITTFAPGVSIRGDSARVSSAIDYNRQQRIFADDTQFNGGDNQLQADVKTILLPGWFFFDTGAQMSQQASDNRRNFNRVNRGNDSNLDDVTTYELTPRVRHTFGSLGTMDLSYERQSIERDQANGGSTGPVRFLDAAAGSSDSDSYVVDLRSGAATGRFPVGINASSREVEYTGGRIDKFKRVAADLSYIWNSRFRFTGRGGYDDNEYQNTRGLNRGVTWSIGGTWTPSRRTSVMVDWGDHFFGKALKVKADHRHRRWNFHFNYDKDVRTAADYQRALQLIPLFDANGLPIFDPVSNGQIFVPIDSPGSTSDVYIERSISAQVEYSFGRSNASLVYSQAKRQSQSRLNDERTRSVTFSVDRALRPRLHANLGAQWRETEATGLSTPGSYYSIFPSLDYSLSRHATARLRYEYTVNDNNDFGGVGFFTGQENYIENAVTASLIFHL